MADEVSIRRFSSADAPAVAKLWRQSLPSDQPWNEPFFMMGRKVAANDRLFFVGVLDQEIVATVAAGYDGVRGWIYALAVADNHQRQGIGKRMLAEAEKALLAKGCPKVNLQVRAGQDQVRCFYEHCGYSLEERDSMGKPLPVDPVAVVDPPPVVPVDEQFTLTPVSWNDKPVYVEHLNATKEFHDNMGRMPYPYEPMDFDQWMTRVTSETLEGDGRRSWAIRNERGEAVGGIGLFDMAVGEKAEMGYWLAKPYWGRGVTSSAARTLCDFAFAEYDLRRVFAQAFARNKGSARVLQKAGFKLEGRLRNHFFRNGEALDVLCFGRMRNEPGNQH